MKTKTRFSLLLIMMQSIILLACQEQIGGNIPLMDKTHEVAHTLLPPIKIATDNFLYPQWSSDSITLTYKVDSIRYGYNTIDSSILEAKEIECVGIYVIDYCKKTVDRDIYLIPPEISDLDIFVSPSEELAIFMVLIPDPKAPTPEPYDEAYPNPVNGGPRHDMYDVWVTAVNNSPIKIGAIPACWYDEIIWGADETKVIIPRGEDIRRCGDYSGWVLDLNQKYLIPVVAYDIYGLEALIYNVSPNGEHFSFSGYINSQEKIFVFDLNTLIAKELNVPGFLTELDWISENHILVDYEGNSGFLGPGIFDLSSNQVIPLASSIANPEYCERQYFISPDKNWLAFTVTIGCYGQPEERITELWLIDISDFK